MKGFKITRNFWVVLVTLLVLGVIFVYYLLVYVEGREQAIYDRKFRELNRLSKNINSFKDEIIAQKRSQVLANQKELDSLYTILYNDTDLNAGLDEIFEKIEQLEESIRAVQTGDRFHIYKEGAISINLSRSLEDLILNRIDSGSKLIVFRVILQSEDSSKMLINSAEETNESVAEYKRESYTRSDRVISKASKLRGRTSKIIFQNLDSEVRLENLDSLIRQKNGLTGSGVTDITIGNTRYKLFSHWLKLGEGDDLLLCAVEKASTIRNDTMAIEPWLIIQILTIVLFLFLGMPLLKLLIMNEVERLQIRNVFFTGAAITVGTALMALFANFTYQYFGKSYESMEHELKLLNQIATNRFLNEVDSIDKQLSIIEPCYSNLKPGSATRVYNSALENDTTSSRLTTYRTFNQIFWMDSLGKMSLVLASGKINASKQRLPVVDKRSYFKATQQDGLWNRNGSFLYVDFIRSMLDGQYQVVVAKRNSDVGAKKPKALALSTKMFSLQFANLPPGYKVAIIDEKGEVKYHSDANKSLQENFLDEVDKNPELVAAIHGRIAQLASIRYHKEDYKVYITPIKGMPLYLVTFYSMNYYRSPIVVTVWFTASLWATLLVFICISLVLLYGLTHKPSKLKIKRFFLGWLRPRKNESYRFKYLQAITGSGLVILLLLVALAFFPVSKAGLITLLVVPVFLLVFHYWLFAEPGHHGQDEENSMQIKRRLLIANSIMIVLIDLIAMYVFANINLYILLFQVAVALVLLFPFTRLFERLAPYILPNSASSNIYISFVFAWLLLVSVIPAFYFYKFSYQTEQKIWIRHQQLALARAHEARERKLEGQFKVFGKSMTRLKELGDYHNATGIFALQNSVRTEVSHDSEVYESFLFELTPPINPINTSRAQAYASTHDSRWFWKSCCNTLELIYQPILEKASSIKISTPLVPYKFHDGHAAFIFWFAIGGICLVAYRAIRFAVRSIYGLNVIKSGHEIALSEDFFELLENKNKNFFMIGLPYSGKGKILKAFVKQNTRKLVQINLQTQLENLPFFDRAEVVLIEHFEFGLNNHELNKKRLQLLQTLQAKPIRVILCSTVQPHVILDYYDRMELLTTHLKERDEFKNEFMEYKHAKRYWRNVLSGYVVVYLPLNIGSSTPIPENDIVKSELNHGTFLPKLKDHMASQPHYNADEREDFILKVEDMATPYYHSLWNSFSNAERRLLFDLALDRFVNVKNVMVIRQLLQKGVLQIGDSLQIFNRSFNNFILSVVKEDEEMQMQEELRDKGSWNTVQLVLIMVFVAAAAFVAFAQREMLPTFNALLTALGGVTALMLRFGGLFTTSGKPKV